LHNGQTASPWLQLARGMFTVAASMAKFSHGHADSLIFSALIFFLPSLRRRWRRLFRR